MHKTNLWNDSFAVIRGGPHYWLYSSGENASHWDICEHKGVVLLGWGSLGDLKNYEDKNSIICESK